MDLSFVASWVHLLATVILVGCYVVMAVIVLPSVSGLPAGAGIGIIAALERRALPALVVRAAAAGGRETSTVSARVTWMFRALAAPGALVLLLTAVAQQP